MTRLRKRPPFTIDRNDARSLLRQVTDGLRLAISDGYYRCGDLLPSSRDLAPALGVSKIVTEAALKRLAAEGLVESRPRVGTVVRDLNAKQWRGHVVLVCPELDTGPYQTTMAESLRTHLNRAGYLFTRATVEGDGAEGGKYDFSLLDAALARSVDLAIILYNRPAIFRHLASRGVPYAVVGNVPESPAGAVGVVKTDYAAAVPDFVASCVAAGIRKVVQFRLSGIMCDAAPALRGRGIAVTTVSVKPDSRKGWFFASEQAGLEGVVRYARSHTFERDDLVFFASDHMASGGLLALAGMGLSAPDGIRVATWANAGLGPVYFRELSRMDMDPERDGSTVADATFAYFKTGQFPADAVLRPRWIQGATMGVGAATKTEELKAK